MPNIVIVGSINMDLVVRCAHLPAPGETIIADSSAEIPGGKGANQAVAAARAGGNVKMIGRVGDDAFAGRLIDNLKHENIDTTGVRISNECPSGIAVVAVERSGENAIMVVPGANGHVWPIDVESCAEMIASADVLLLQLEIPLETVREAISMARKEGVRVILDPAPLPADFPLELLDVDVVCPNQSEAAAIVGNPVETIEQAHAAIERLHDLGAKNAIITMAAQGAVVSDSRSIQHLPPFKVAPVDTTAAGDAFAGAFAVRLGEGASLIEATRFACGAGAIAATREGAQPGMATRNEIQDLVDGQ
jgi:ribokinase